MMKGGRTTHCLGNYVILSIWNRLIYARFECSQASFEEAARFYDSAANAAPSPGAKLKRTSVPPTSDEVELEDEFEDSSEY